MIPTNWHSTMRLPTMIRGNNRNGSSSEEQQDDASDRDSLDDDQQSVRRSINESNNLQNSSSQLSVDDNKRDSETSATSSTSTGGAAANANGEQQQQRGDGMTALERARYEEEHYDSNLLQKSVADAGRWAFGTVFVEVWALSDDRTYLWRPEAGSWIDPVFHDATECRQDCKKCKLIDQLSNEDCEDYIPPGKLSPGEGLQGALWTITSMYNLGEDSPLQWLNVNQLAMDPDQPWNPRLKLFDNLGLGWAAGVPFNQHGRRGIVVYMARSAVNMRRLNSETNQQYLIAAADLIGAAYALGAPRQAVVAERKREVKATIRRVRMKLLLGITLQRPNNANNSLENNPKQSSQFRLGGMTGFTTDPVALLNGVRKFNPCAEIKSVVKTVKRTTVQKTKTLIRKCKGRGSVPIVPTFDWRETCLTFFGVMSTLIIITYLKAALEATFKSEVLIGPFGALMALQYGLMHAPSSQPRSIILGQGVSLSIALFFSYATTMTPWLRESLTTAVVVSVMVKLGIMHPPAGATAMTFSQGNLGWGSMALMLTGNIIAIVIAMLINNLSDKRQYPLYWDFGWGNPMVKQSRRRIRDRIDSLRNTITGNAAAARGGGGGAAATTATHATTTTSTTASEREESAANVTAASPEAPPPIAAAAASSLGSSPIIKRDRTVSFNV